MAKTGVLTESGYRALLRDVRKLIEEGRQRASQAAHQELVRTYWEVGKRVSEERLTENAGYGDAILEDLSDELGIDLSTLNRCIHFFKEYNIAPSGNNLTWSHYRALLPIGDKTERKWYEDLVAENTLTAGQLGRAIKEKRFEQTLKSKKKKAPGLTLRRPLEPTYIYKATVKRVVDGDTLLLQIDLGFQVFKEQRVRLAGIDAPSLDQPNGQESANYIREQLAQAEFVMVKTNKIDVYGRYVGHVFYSFKEKDNDKIFTNGRYLNQELVEKSLARVL